MSARALSQQTSCQQFAMDTPSAAGEKRKRDDGATTPAPKLGVVRVEKATTGRGHCGWCDTQIEVGSPRVVKHQYHHAGKYSRNNGASTGYNPGGFQDMFLHPQCAWHVMLSLIHI